MQLAECEKMCKNVNTANFEILKTLRVCPYIHPSKFNSLRDKGFQQENVVRMN